MVIPVGYYLARAGLPSALEMEPNEIRGFCVRKERTVLNGALLLTPRSIHDKIRAVGGVCFSDLHRAISIRPGPPAPGRVRESDSGTAMESPAKSPRAVVNQRQIATGTDAPVSQIAPQPLGSFRTTDCRIRWLRHTRAGLENRSLRKGTGGSNPPLSASKEPRLVS
jgi:hypothetical protein